MHMKLLRVWFTSFFNECYLDINGIREARSNVGRLEIQHRTSDCLVLARTVQHGSPHVYRVPNPILNSNPIK